MMSNSIESNDLIKDAGIANEVAYSAKDLRSIAAGIRSLGQIAAETKEIKTFEFDKHHALTERIMAARAIYPEAFDRLFHTPDQSPGQVDAELPTAISEIFKNGELPTRNVFTGENVNSAQTFDNEAEAIEDSTQLTEVVKKALLEQPPSQDFLRDHGLGYAVARQHITNGYELVVTAEKVKGLLSTANFLEHRLNAAATNFGQKDKYYKELDDGNDHSVTKLDTIISMLDVVGPYMPFFEDEPREEFQNKLKDAKNSRDTKLEDYEALYKSGKDEALRLNEAARDRSLAMFNAIISGDASRYKSSNVDTEKTAS